MSTPNIGQVRQAAERRIVAAQAAAMEKEAEANALRQVLHAVDTLSAHVERQSARIAELEDEKEKSEE